MKSMKEKGFIQIIIIVILLVIILSLLGVSLSALFSNPILKQNFGFLGEWLSGLWNSYLAAPFRYVFNTLVDLVWQPFVDTLTGLKSGINPFNK